MTIQLTQKEAIHLLMGATGPHFNLFNDPLIGGLGYYIDSKGWTWDNSKLMELSTKQIYQLYNRCENSWV